MGRREPTGCSLRVLFAAMLLLTGCGGPAQLAPLADEAVVLAFGDSLTHGTGVSAEHSYPAVLDQRLPQRVIRAGVPGEISSDGVRRLREALAEHRPDLVVLCHGGNDVLRRLPVARTEANLREMIRLVRESGAQVVVLAVPKFGLFPEPQELYDRLADDLMVPVEFDIVSDLEADSAMKSDRVHFNREGYRKMAEAVHRLLIAAGAVGGG